jgi:hypothetical protein
MFQDAINLATKMRHTFSPQVMLQTFFSLVEKYSMNVLYHRFEGVLRIEVKIRISSFRIFIIRFARLGVKGITFITNMVWDTELVVMYMLLVCFA